MKQRPFSDLALSLPGLLENGHHQVALKILQQAFDACQTYQQSRDFLALLQSLPQSFWQGPDSGKIYLQALCRAREPKKILEWFQHNSASPCHKVYQAWALVRNQAYQEALDVLRQAQPASDMDWGIFYRSRGEALFWLNQPGWREVLEQSRAHLRGGALGRMLLDLGTFLHQQGNRPAARVAWAEAISYLEHDPYYLAWAHDALGYLLLPEQPQEAETHLLRALELSKKTGARSFRARALAGLGAVRRSLGEWQRALDSYQRAYRAAQEPDDQTLALWGWALVLRLRGRPEEALAKLLQAQRQNPKAQWLEAEIASARLMLGETLAPAELEGLPQHVRSERGRVLVQVLQAEQARRQEGPEEARRRLRGLAVQTLWAREELSCFPALARLLQSQGTLQPQQNHVWVKPFGRLAVRVNGREVPLAGVSKAGELLVYLLVQGREASLEAMVEDLGNPQSKNPRKALWENIDKLRAALGWKESVQVARGVCTLDPQAHWECDLTPPPDVFDPSQTFMAGYYSNWVEEYRQQFMVV